MAAAKKAAAKPVSVVETGEVGPENVESGVTITPVRMAANSWDHKAGDVVWVTPETADRLVSGGHATTL